jgi:hypothetical protein
MQKQEHQFTDECGRTWSLKVNVNSYQTIRDDHGVDITDMSEGQTSWMSTLADDMPTFLAILCVLTEVERGERELSLEEFFEGLGGDVLVEATDAILQAVVNFLPVHRRLAFTKIMEKIKLGHEMVGLKVAAGVDKMFPTEDLEKRLDSALEKYTT